MKLRYVGFGVVFGFVLSRVGATDYDAIAGMFRLTDMHLMGVIGLAVAISAAGFEVLKRTGTRTGEPLALAPKAWQSGVVGGGLLFGAGWAISGTCPGTSLAQIGEGRLAGVVTFAGILLGAWLQQRVERAKAAQAAAAPTRSMDVSPVGG